MSKGLEVVRLWIGFTNSCYTQSHPTEFTKLGMRKWEKPLAPLAPSAPLAPCPKDLPLDCPYELLLHTKPFHGVHKARHAKVGKTLGSLGSLGTIGSLSEGLIHQNFEEKRYFVRQNPILIRSPLRIFKNVQLIRTIRKMLINSYIAKK